MSEAAAPRRTALVTGASRGIGKQVALALARAGFDVAFTARTVREGEGVVPPRTQREGERAIAVPGSLDSTAAAVTALGVRALPVPMDLTDLASVRAAARTVLDAWGRIDVLVNNAILHVPHARLLELDLDALTRSLTANHVHQLALVQEVVPAMVAQGGGTVVDLWSGSVRNDPPAPPGEGGWGLAYSSAKAAFGRIAGAINAEYREAGVRAFNVDPGFVVTEAAAARGGTDQIAAHGVAMVAEDAAGRVIAWLATSPESDAHLGTVVRAARLVERLG
ncbi:SDR family NAD(P)-dependent oxidoreductase [Nocardioides sp. dk4132]|uniref:SDR family oxidoreductase n=1 Tax=unclassified Nocardioides TaxID=2615069 RepID=UPI0012948F5D|nr:MULTISPECIES: SDR family oxidoreductase [unclassified Nocardioides]MQW74394.1 SDR family NAD(P)-dependent oxidoreductase [Nocardioides sp. dk4132]QGA06336.1 SDR family NAD(P)-dependent oxidoreductase [Nocardioides sp. dk884]